MPFSDRDVMLDTDPAAFYVTDHYRPYPAVLMRLSRMSRAVAVAVIEAWRQVAPKRLVESGSAPETLPSHRAPSKTSPAPSPRNANGRGRAAWRREAGEQARETRDAACDVRADARTPRPDLRDPVGRQPDGLDVPVLRAGLPHDVVHLVVETCAGLRSGLWGRVDAAGDPRIINAEANRAGGRNKYAAFGPDQTELQIA